MNHVDIARAPAHADAPVPCRMTFWTTASADSAALPAQTFPCEVTTVFGSNDTAVTIGGGSKDEGTVGAGYSVWGYMQFDGPPTFTAQSFANTTLANMKVEIGPSISGRPTVTYLVLGGLSPQMTPVLGSMSLELTRTGCKSSKNPETCDAHGTLTAVAIPQPAHDDTNRKKMSPLNLSITF